MLLLALPLLAASPAAVGASAADTAERWRGELRRIGDRILAGAYREAEVSAVDLARRMGDEIVGGGGADLLLAMVTAYRALAVAGQDRGDEAVWHWQLAQQLFPRVTELDLGRFGPPGRFLAMHPPRGSIPAAGEESRSGGGSQAGFVPPSRLEAPLPEFPDGRAFRGLRVDVVVEVVVDEEGRPEQPLVLESNGEPTLIWATLEALRRWRFSPARRDGVAVPALYRLTASFVVPSG